MRFASASSPLLLGLLLSACSAPRPPALDAPPAPKSTANPAATARCANGACACRPLDGSGDSESPAPAAGLVRVELRLFGSADPMWVTLAGLGTVYRPPEPPTELCYYADLAPGPHELVFRVAAQDPAAGFTARLAVADYVAQTSRWADALDVSCGGTNGPCTKDAMAEIKSREDAIPRGIVDACGQAGFRKLTWAGAHRAPDSDALSDLEIDAEIVLAKQAPVEPSKCRAAAP